MAGNTKLLGFSFNGREVSLERWGEKVDVKVSASSVAAMRQACISELPKKPNAPYHIADFESEYDERLGRIILKLSVKGAHELVGVLERGRDSGELLELRNALFKALDKHKDYHNIKDEPGLE